MLLKMTTQKRRIVEKNGNLRTKLGIKHATLFSWQYIKDFFISTMHLGWTTLYLTFIGLFFGSWFGFAIVWWFVFWFHGDFEAGLTIDTCATNIFGFTSCFLFSGKCSILLSHIIFPQNFLTVERNM